MLNIGLCEHVNSWCEGTILQVTNWQLERRQAAVLGWVPTCTPHPLCWDSTRMKVLLRYLLMSSLRRQMVLLVSFQVIIFSEVHLLFLIQLEWSYMFFRTMGWFLVFLHMCCLFVPPFFMGLFFFWSRLLLFSTSKQVRVRPNWSISCKVWHACLSSSHNQVGLISNAMVDMQSAGIQHLAE